MFLTWLAVPKLFSEADSCSFLASSVTYPAPSCSGHPLGHIPPQVSPPVASGGSSRWSKDRRTCPEPVDETPQQFNWGRNSPPRFSDVRGLHSVPQGEPSRHARDTPFNYLYLLPLLLSVYFNWPELVATLGASNWGGQFRLHHGPRLGSADSHHIFIFLVCQTAPICCMLEVWDW